MIRMQVVLVKPDSVCLLSASVTTLALLRTCPPPSLPPFVSPAAVTDAKKRNGMSIKKTKAKERKKEKKGGTRRMSGLSRSCQFRSCIGTNREILDVHTHAGTCNTTSLLQNHVGLATLEVCQIINRPLFNN